MSVPLRLAAFALVLVLAFGGAALAGSVIDPTRDEVATADGGHGGGSATAGADAHGSGEQEAAGGDAHGGDAGHDAEAAAEPSGLAVSRDGLALEVERTFLPAGRATPLRFRIADERGRVIRDEFEVEHDRELHLIVVRRDTAAFQHVHPRKGGDGTWSIDLTLREPGVYRMYADFTIGGKQRTLATDLFVAGDFRPDPLPAPSPVDETGDLRVELTSARPLAAGQARTLVFAVTRRGEPVRDLQPYLGARGHLVALREGDLAYLHVHPDDGIAGNAVGFAATFPSAGRYRLFLQFKHEDRVRTVAYTVQVPR